MNDISITPGKKIFEPFDKVEISIENPTSESKIIIADGDGNEYLNIEAESAVEFLVAGALGTHNIYYCDRYGKMLDNIKFRVDCKTEILDEGEKFGGLLNKLHYTMIHWNEASNCLYKGHMYKYFVCWLRDHVHTLKGMKYFHDDLKSAIELYRDTQREDGMIFDNIYLREDKKSNYWDQRFGYGDFIRVSEDDTIEFKRIPVENDVEYLFNEGIYYTWKATGDDFWMQSMLDSAVKAYNYSTTDPYRWSEKYGLLKRGYTIDTWDFQSSFDDKVMGDPMAIDKDRTNFSIMHGDNTGFIAGCRYLAEMLRHSGREKESLRYEKLADEMNARLDALSWNGSFFTHHVPENQVIRDFGVDTSKQVSLSNSYALNRGISLEQKEAIIEKYLQIREELPYGAPGEWYTIYPPFENGYGGHNGKWQYMNGGVISITAGELAHGAFESGFEKYGVDILDRINCLAERHDGYLHCCFRGAMPEPQKDGFKTIDLSKYANTDTCGKGADGVPGWTGEGENDLHEMPFGMKLFENVPFEIPDPGLNGRRSCIALKSSPIYAGKVEIDLNSKAKSIYLLHTMSGGLIAGSYTLSYEDGSTVTRYITRDSEVQGWWFPSEDKARPKRYSVAWEGKNAVCKRVGVVMYGFDNPFPEKKIDKVIFECSKDGSFWAIFGITLSQGEININPGEVSFGIPDNWGAAAVVYGLVEGLAGVVDKDTAFRDAEISPRWSSAGINNCTTCVKYPASRGYIKYFYEHCEAEKTIRMLVTGNGHSADIHCLLPGMAREVTGVKVDGVKVEYKTSELRDSTYVDVGIAQKGITEISIQYK